MDPDDKTDENDIDVIPSIIIKLKGEECIQGENQCDDGLLCEKNSDDELYMCTDQCLPNKNQCPPGFTCERDWYNRQDSENNKMYACQEGPTPNPFTDEWDCGDDYYQVLSCCDDKNRNADRLWISNIWIYVLLIFFALFITICSS